MSAIARKSQGGGHRAAECFSSDLSVEDLTEFIVREVPVLVGADPLVALAGYGAGRAGAFTSDCSPHWAPPAFCEEWDGYADLFDGLVRWLVRA